MGFKVLDNTKPKGIIKWTGGIFKWQSIPFNRWSDVFREYKQIYYTSLSIW